MNSNFLTNMALGMLKNKNPQAAGMLEQIMKSGKTPQQAFAELTNSGNIDAGQLSKVKDFAKQMGINIPDGEISNLQNTTNQSNNSDRF